jgi:hypothetical protein
MRLLVAVLLIASTATALHAQRASAPVSSIGLPLPPIGLPLPTIGLPAPAEVLTPFDPGGRGRVGRQHRRHPVPIVFFGAPYAFGFEPWEQSPEPGMVASPPDARLDAPVPETGRIQLDVTPRDAQLYVDGAYVGTLLDHRGELDLPAGTHRLEVKAPTFEPLGLDVRIVTGRTISYRAELIPLAPVPDAPRQEPTPPTPFYLIPGCYLGNVHPSQVKLPAGCDLSRMVTHLPSR